MLNPSSRLKGEKDMEKYEKARMLKDKIEKIREDYTEGDFNGNFFHRTKVLQQFSSLLFR